MSYILRLNHKFRQLFTLLDKRCQYFLWIFVKLSNIIYLQAVQNFNYIEERNDGK